MTRRRLTLTALPLLGALLAALIGEGGLRALDAVRPFRDGYRIVSEVEIYSSHPSLHHTLTPSLDFVRPAHVDVDIPAYRLRTNRLGFRFDEERFARASGGALRIAVLGDSVIEGYAEEHTLPRLLEPALGETGGHPVEVMNFGVMSHSPVIHFVNLRENVLRYRPQVVVIHFDMTDVFDDSVRYRDAATWDADGSPLRVSPGIEFSALIRDGRAVPVIEIGRQLALARSPFSPRRAVVELFDRSLLFRVLYWRSRGPERMARRYLDEYLLRHPEVRPRPHVDLSRIHSWCYEYDNPEIQEQVRFSLSMLERCARLLERQGIRPVVVTIPIRPQLAPRGGEARASMQPMQRLREFCREKGIPFHAPVEEFSAHLRRGEELYFSDGMHPNYRGQDVWARALAAYLTTGVLAEAR